jgi:hypothetical protein
VLLRHRRGANTGAVHAPQRCGKPHNISEKTPSFTVISENAVPIF